MKSIRFTNILDVDKQLKEKVRQWRNKEEIRKFMLTQHIISREEHLKWLENLSKNEGQKFWIIFVDDVPIGSVYLQNINYKALNSEWGFYIGEDTYLGKGLAGLIIYKMLTIFFEEMKFDTLLTRALSNNTRALNLYRKFRFVDITHSVGNDSNKIVTMRFTRNEWIESKEDFKKQFA